MVNLDIAAVGDNLDIGYKQQIDDTARSVKAKIDGWNMSSVIERLVKIDGWATGAAKNAIVQYRNFLFLKWKYNKHHILPPSKDIDDVWHAHILHTKDYVKFCRYVYGYYLHHSPHLTEEARSYEELKRLFEDTQVLYKREFGMYIEAIRRSKLVQFFGDAAQRIKAVFSRR